MMTIAEQLEKKGKREEQIEIAQNMLKNNMDIETVSKITKLEIEKVKELKEEASPSK